jgi:hypothetical protein
MRTMRKEGFSLMGSKAPDYPPPNAKPAIPPPPPPMRFHPQQSEVELAEARREIELLKADRSQFLREALVAIAGAVCTPEKGYEADGGFGLLLGDVRTLRRQRDAFKREAEERRTFKDRAADNLALKVFDWIERGIIQTRTSVSDALESWAACRFNVCDGTEIQKLRAFAATAKCEVSKRE